MDDKPIDKQDILNELEENLTNQKSLNVNLKLLKNYMSKDILILEL